MIEVLVQIILIPYFFIMLIGVVVAVLTRGRRCAWALEMQSPGYRDRRKHRAHEDDPSTWL